MKQEFSEKMVMLMQLHYSRLSEKDRQQYAALESLKLGRGGITYISRILGVDRKTILQGIKELTLDLPNPIPQGRQRKAGGGRKKNG
jgi:transcriptional regulator of acetoin/glycerol metabolism